MTGKMEEYIRETPIICDRIFYNRKSILKGVREYFRSNHPKRILLIASGSSHNAAISARYFMEELLGIEVSVRNPQLYLKYDLCPEPTDLVIGISQSGRSTSIIDGLEKSKLLGVKTFALTNNLLEAIKECGAEMIPLSCGIESIGYVTKGYTATVLQLFLVALEGSLSNRRISLKEYDKLCGLIMESIGKMPEIISKTVEWVDARRENLESSERVMVIGSGPHQGTAAEGSLKIGETVRIPSSGYEIEEFMHGPYLELSPKHTVFFVHSGGQSKEKVELLYRYISRHCIRSYCISSEGIKGATSLSLELPGEETILPLAMILPLQIITARICDWKSIDLNEDPFPDFGAFMGSKLKAKVCSEER